MATAPRYRTRPVPARRSRGHLRVIPGGRRSRPAPGKVVRTSQRMPRVQVRFAAAASAVVAAFVFGLVLLHVLLAQSAFRLQGLQGQVAREESRYREMRYRVATEEAPSRIAGAASGIGLVVPQEQRYLVAPSKEAP